MNDLDRKARIIAFVDATDSPEMRERRRALQDALARALEQRTHRWTILNPDFNPKDKESFYRLGFSAEQIALATYGLAPEVKLHPYVDGRESKETKAAYRGWTRSMRDAMLRPRAEAKTEADLVRLASVLATGHLSVREAAQVSGYSKSTIHRLRQRLASAGVPPGAAIRTMEHDRGVEAVSTMTFEQVRDELLKELRAQHEETMSVLIAHLGETPAETAERILADEAEE